MQFLKILNKLPYSKPFLFVDEIESATEEKIVGNYTFPEDSFFYNGHFKNNPITPGVILTETMAQIGLVCFGIYLLGETFTDKTKIAFTSSDVHFLKPVFPKEKVTVVSKKIYFRFGKLKCEIKLYNQKQEEICKGILSGMLVN
ncbi:MAG: 3-hydroxyacyl-[acyl-carrier-protein] dehydratase [Flavobacterium sp.]|jgi:3-hydroxyacyl-[acyl-carrier-protein] dehydratase